MSTAPTVSRTQPINSPWSITNSTRPLDFAELHRRYASRMLSVAGRFLRCRQDREDAVQDAFVRAMNAEQTFRGRSSAWTWLCRILINECLMKLRQQSRRKWLTFSEIDEKGFSTPADHCSAWAETGHNNCPLSRHETQHELMAALHSLPQAQQLMIRLRDIEELDTQQTAAVLGISCAAVKTRLHRARRMMREALESLAVETSC